MPISFDSILGNEKAKKYLLSMLEKEKVGQLLLFSGIEGIGKSLFAEHFAKKLLNADSLINHPDFYIYRPEGKLGMHSIESIRTMCEKVYLPPFLASKKIFVIHAAERMLPSSANALLKTFEEPSLNTLIILLSSNKRALLPTILSRCRAVRFLPIEQELIVEFLIKNCNKTESEADEIAAKAFGSIGKAFRLSLKGDDPVRNKLLALLSCHKVKLYSEIAEAAKTIAESLEEVKSQEEAATKTLLLKKYIGDVTASEMQHITKESEGAAAIAQTDFAQTLFEQVLSWYRDIILLKEGGDPALLANPDFLMKLQEAVTLNSPFTIESVQKKIAEAKLLLERSTSLNIVLENLFLKLNFL